MVTANSGNRHSTLSRAMPSRLYCMDKDTLSRCKIQIDLFCILFEFAYADIPA